MNDILNQQYQIMIIFINHLLEAKKAADENDCKLNYQFDKSLTGQSSQNGKAVEREMIRLRNFRESDKPRRCTLSQCLSVNYVWLLVYK